MGGRRPTEQEPTLFGLIAEIALALDAAPMSRWPEGWVLPVDAQWQLVVNGELTAIRWQGVEILPFHVYVTYDGWAAGMFSPEGGILAAGAAANEAALIRALTARLAAIRAT